MSSPCGDGKRRRRRGSSGTEWGVLLGLSVKTNGLPTDDMVTGGTRSIPASPRWDPWEETATAEKSSEQQRRKSGHSGRGTQRRRSVMGLRMSS